MKRRIISLLLTAATALSFAVQADAAELKVSESELPEYCTARYGYEDMKLRSNTEGRQKLYDALFDLCCEVWTGNEDYEVDGFVQRPLAGAINFSQLGLTSDEARSVYYTFRNDNPLFYFVSSRLTVGGYSNSLNVYFCVEDEYAKAADRKKLQAQIVDFIADVSEGAEGLERKYEIAKYYRDKLVDIAEYAYVDNGNGTYSPDSSATAHNILGIITNGRGVCESYAKTFELLLSYSGVPNAFVTGKGNGGDHAWNIAKMDDGNFYNFDVTWDDSTYSYDYFAAGSKSFDEQHSADTPDGTGPDFLYALPDIPEADYDGVTVIEEPEPQVKLGDLDGSGVINMKDLALMQRYLNGWDVKVKEAALDMNGDGKVNMKDHAELGKYLNNNLDY